MNCSCPEFVPSAAQCVTGASVFGCMPYSTPYSQEFDDAVAISSIPLSLIALTQVYSMWRAQQQNPESHKAVSMTTWLLTVIVNVIWVFDGMMHRSYTIFVTNGIQAGVALWVVLLLLKYRHFYCDERPYTRCG
jgi:uncharacterized protein with PQ loop repeat